MGLSAVERETVILFNESDKLAVVYTNNIALKNRLAKLSLERSVETVMKAQDGYGGVTYSVPKRWVKILCTRSASDAQKVALERARQKIVTMSQLGGSPSSQP